MKRRSSSSEPDPKQEGFEQRPMVRVLRTEQEVSDAIERAIRFEETVTTSYRGRLEGYSKVGVLAPTQPPVGDAPPVSPPPSGSEVRVAPSLVRGVSSLLTTPGTSHGNVGNVVVLQPNRTNGSEPDLTERQLEDELGIRVDARTSA